MLKNVSKTIFVACVLMLPLLASAQLFVTTKFFQSADSLITNILVPLAFTLALLFFFWGVAKYIRTSGSDKDEGKKIMVWGVVALFVMASVWGIVSFLQDELLINKSTEQVIPTLK